MDDPKDALSAAEIIFALKEQLATLQAKAEAVPAKNVTANPGKCRWNAGYEASSVKGSMDCVSDKADDTSDDYAEECPDDLSKLKFYHRDLECKGKCQPLALKSAEAVRSSSCEQQHVAKGLIAKPTSDMKNFGVLALKRLVQLDSSSEWSTFKTVQCIACPSDAGQVWFADQLESKATEAELEHFRDNCAAGAFNTSASPIVLNDTFKCTPEQTELAQNWLLTL